LYRKQPKSATKEKRLTRRKNALQEMQQRRQRLFYSGISICNDKIEKKKEN
jgi:hypothetical protein